MRKITQLVAVIVALLFASQSALAGVPCAHWLMPGGDHAQGCCEMATGSGGQQLGMDCHSPMDSDTVTTGCSECGCQVATDRALVQPKASLETKAQRVVAAVSVAPPPATRPTVLRAPSQQGASAPGPAKHLLFQVFRI